MRRLSAGDVVNLLLAHEAGEFTEGRLVELLGVDRLTLRGWKMQAIKRGRVLAEKTEEELESMRRAIHANSSAAASGATTLAQVPSSSVTPTE